MTIEPNEKAPEVMSETRPLYWSLRRELWENRSIYIAPLIVAGLALFAFVVTSHRYARQVRGLWALDAARQFSVAVKPFSVVASMIMLTGFIVAAFYCLDALHGERRDRSILFWKSLPVSDRTTVLSKMLIPMAIQPLVTFVIAIAVQWIILLLATLVLLATGVSPATLWRQLPLIQMPMTMLYGLLVHVLWYAPIYAWLLLVSAWAKRATFLWAVMPFFAIFVFEKMALGVSYFAAFLKYRFLGAMAEGFSDEPGKRAIARLSQLDPVGFFTSSGLWFGLLFAAIFFAAAVRLRRNREPI